MRLRRRVDTLTHSMDVLRENEETNWSLLWDLKVRFQALENAHTKRCTKCRQKLPPPKGHGRA